MSKPKGNTVRTKQQNPRKSLVIFGAGGTGLYIAEVAERTGRFKVEGFLDDDSEKFADGYSGYSVLGPLKHWERLPGEYSFANSLYGPKKNQLFANIVTSLGVPDNRWETVIDPSAVVSSRATMQFGCFVGPGCVIEPMTRVGRLCALLGNVYLAHNTQVEPYTVFANSASVAGGVVIGPRCYIGANASVREYTRIGANALVGMGCVVVKDVPDGQVVVGNPARFLSPR